MDARPTNGESGGDCLLCLGLGGTLHAGGVITGILLVRVLRAAQAELAARVLPRLALAIPMETKLRELLPNLGGGLFLELNPNPLPDYLGQAIGGGQLLVQKGQHLRRRQCAIGFPCFRINRRQVAVPLTGIFPLWRGCAFRCCLCRLL